MRRAVARDTLAATAASDSVMVGRCRPKQLSTARPLASVAMNSLSSDRDDIFSRVSMRPAGERLTRPKRHLRCAHNELLFDNRTQPGWSIQIRTPADRGRDAGRETGEVCHDSTPGSAPACPQGF